MDSADIVEALRDFGAVDHEVLSFAGALGPQHIHHLDLHPKGCDGGRPLGVDAAVCPDNRVLLYVVRGGLSPAQQDALADRLAQRGEGEFVGFLEPGVLTVVPTAFAHRRQRRSYKASDDGARDVIPGLTFGTSDLVVDGADRVLHEALLKLFNGSVEALTRVGVSPEDALSLVGRAMFFRFLIDRGFVLESEASALAAGARRLRDAMSTASGVRATMRWLDDTFNGHLLPLSEDVDWRLSVGIEDAAILQQLTRILSDSNAAGQQVFDWCSLDFAHLPIGLLSEVYEHWAHTYDGARAKRESAWYTPAAMAQGIVREALDAVAEPWQARVLDPACGAGVFLAAAFRKLVQARWEHTGQRPDRETLRRILSAQLTGLEVNDAALRLTALSLYLTALELDPEPGPSARVPFPDLMAQGVLRDVRATEDHARIAAERPPLGSLGAHVDPSLEGRFDVVVGNPPWTRWGVSSPDGATAAREVVSVVGPIVRARLGEAEGAGYQMTNGLPDLPFLWRATQWAAPDGVLGFVLHGHWLFQQTPQAQKRRAEVLRGLTVSTIVNGTALRRATGVWAGQEAPFFILFARNRAPLEGERFRYISPMQDDALNKRGRMRLDATAAHPVSPVEAAAKPWLFKTLFRGGPLDVALVEKVSAASGGVGLGAWWPEAFSGLGYRNAQKGGTPALNMHKCYALESDATCRVALPEEGGDRFQAERVLFPTFTNWQKHHAEEVAAGLAPRQFRGPLIVVRKVPRAGEEHTSLAWWAPQDTVYSQSFLGLSAAWHPNPQGLARYLLVCLNSTILRHRLLMCAADWGIERGTLLVEDLRSLPLPRWESVPEALRAAIDDCGVWMIANDRLDGDRCDHLVAELYGLSPADIECARDTVAMASPTSAKAAQQVPGDAAVRAYCARVEEILGPLLAYAQRRLRVRAEAHVATAAWQLLTLTTRHDDAPTPSRVLEEALLRATHEGASWVIVPTGADTQTVVVGVFRQARYWTPTQARALVLHLLGDADVMASLRGRGA